MGNWFVYPTVTDLGAKKQGVKISINGSPERTTGTDGRCELSKNTLGKWGAVPNGDFTLMIKWNSIVKYARLELHSNRADSLTLGVVISGVWWWGTAGTWVYGTKVDDRHWKPSAGTQKDPYQAKIEFYVQIDLSGIKLASTPQAAAAGIVLPVPAAPAVPVAPAAPVATAVAPTPTPAVGATDELRLHFVKLPFSTEQGVKDKLPLVAGAVSPFVKPFGYSQVGDPQLNWSEQYISIFYAKKGSPVVPLVPILAAVCVIAITVAIIWATWVSLETKKIEAQESTNLDSLLTSGKITPDQYTAIKTATQQQQGIWSGVTAALGGAGTFLVILAGIWVISKTGILERIRKPEAKAKVPVPI